MLSRIEQNWSELPDRAWVSRLWVQYSKLPESFKKGFINLAQCLAQENGNDKTPLNGQFSRILEKNNGNYEPPVNDGLTTQ